MATIVVGVDDSSHADLAVRWAVGEARLRGVEIELVHGHALDVLGAETTSDRELAAQMMDRIVDRNRDALETVKWTTTVAPVSTAPYSAMLAQTGHHADPLVVGSRGRGGFAGLLLGSTSYRTAAHAPCPVVVVRGDLDGAPPSVRRIVVGVDDSKPAGRALQWALDEAELRTVDVTVVHGHFSPRYEFFEGFESDDQMERERTRAHDEAVQVLDRALEAVRAPAGVDIERITSAVTAAGVLLQHAGPDRLAVVGRSGRGPVGRMLLGSVSHQVLHHATGPVAIIP